MLDLRRALFAPPRLFTPGETVRVRTEPSLARLLTQDEPRILEDIEASLSIRVEIVPEEKFREMIGG